MPIRIKQLTARVTVKTGGKHGALHKSERPVRPALHFAQPVAQTPAETSPDPSEMATEDTGSAAGAKSKPAPSRADPRQVADRVYELMSEEMRLGRLRGL